MRPVSHLGGSLLGEQASALEESQYALAHLLLELRNVLIAHQGLVKAHPVPRGAEYPIDQATVEVHMGIERSPESVDKRHTPEPCLGWGIRPLLPSPLKVCP